MSIVVLVLAARVAPYPMLVRAIERTWASRDVKGVDVLFYSGGTAYARRARELRVPAPDDLGHVGQKTLSAFRHVLEHDSFDLLFRTNCSSYVDLPNLRAFAEEHGRASGFYAGVPGAHEGIEFASGSGYFLSRDLVELVVAQEAALDWSLLDDVALGGLLAANRVHPEPIPRVDFRTVAEARDVDTSLFHFRCRTESWRRVGDLRLLAAVHRAFCRARGEPIPLGQRALGLAEELRSRAKR